MRDAYSQDSDRDRSQAVSSSRLAPTTCADSVHHEKSRREIFHPLLCTPTCPLSDSADRYRQQILRILLNAISRCTGTRRNICVHIQRTEVRSRSTTKDLHLIFPVLIHFHIRLEPVV